MSDLILGTFILSVHIAVVAEKAEKLNLEKQECDVFQSSTYL